MGWEVGGGRWEGGSRGKGYMYILWLIHVDVWQKLTQYCKAIILQLKTINLFTKRRKNESGLDLFLLECVCSQESLHQQRKTGQGNFCFLDIFK